jgi:steroid delta-isomerase-like uncharacterized protein
MTGSASKPDGDTQMTALYSFDPLGGVAGIKTLDAAEAHALTAMMVPSPAADGPSQPTRSRRGSRKKRLALFVTIAAIFVAPFAARADEAANEALARRFYVEFNAGNIDAFDQFMAPDFIDHSAAPGAANGLAAVKAELRGFATAFPDMKIENVKVLAKGDYVTVVSTSKGTNTGPLMGMPASGKPAEIGSIDVWLVKDGRLAEAWHVEQLLQMMMQLGAMGGGNRPG